MIEPSIDELDLDRACVAEFPVSHLALQQDPTLLAEEYDDSPKMFRKSITTNMLRSRSTAQKSVIFMTRRHTIELTPEAARIIEDMHARTGRSRKDLASIAMLKMHAWGPSIEALVYDATPPALLASDAFWESIRENLLRGIERCREKYRGGA